MNIENLNIKLAREALGFFYGGANELPEKDLLQAFEDEKIVNLEDSYFEEIIELYYLQKRTKEDSGMKELKRKLDEWEARLLLEQESYEDNPCGNYSEIEDKIEMIREFIGMIYIEENQA